VDSKPQITSKDPPEMDRIDFKAERTHRGWKAAPTPYQHNKAVSAIFPKWSVGAAFQPRFPFGSTTTRKAGGINSRIEAGNKKAHPCFNRCGCNPPQADLKMTNLIVMRSNIIESMRSPVWRNAVFGGFEATSSLRTL
jgi:hypothetical protein